jgi:hypothetical protein
LVGGIISGQPGKPSYLPSLSHIQIFGQMNLKPHAGLDSVRGTQLMAEPGLEVVIFLE